MPQGCRFRAVRCRWLSGRVSLKLRAGVAQRPIFAASKATLNRMNTRITKEIQQLLDSGDNSLEDYPHSQWLYERIAELERMRKYIKLLKKMKSNRIPAKLCALWLCRIKNSSRTLASTSLDPMSIALPVPPTFEATLSSFGRGRDLNALPC